MRNYLVFQLYGPLASWGDIAVGETRPSALTPAKSAILGLVAAALRLKRPDTIHYEHDEPRTTRERSECEVSQAKLAEGYGIAIKVESLGLPLSDYHTAEVPKGTGYSTRRDEILEVAVQKRTGNFKGTILSRREYRQDTYCAVALWARPDTPYPLNMLRKALLEPGFTLYLGRKACPLALPLQPVIVQAEHIEDALASVSMGNVLKHLAKAERREDSLLTRHFNPAAPLLLWDNDASTRQAPEHTVTRRDAPLSRRRWQFKVRDEHRAQLAQEE